MLYSPTYAYTIHRRILTALVLGTGMNEDQRDWEDLRSLDPQAVGRVHKKYFPEIFRYARFRVEDAHTAEDIVSDVFIRLLESIAAGKGPDRNLRGWLHGTAAHIISDHYRRAYRFRTEKLEEDLPSQSPGPLGIVESADQETALHKALIRLTQEQQHVIALRFGGGYSLEETAKLMGKGVSAVKALQFRAMSSLRRLMEEDA